MGHRQLVAAPVQAGTIDGGARRPVRGKRLGVGPSCVGFRPTGRKMWTKKKWRQAGPVTGYWMIRFRAASKWMVTSTALEVSPMQVEDMYHNLGIGPGLYSLYPSNLGG